MQPENTKLTNNSKQKTTPLLYCSKWCLKRTLSYTIYMKFLQRKPLAPSYLVAPKLGKYKNLGRTPEKYKLFSNPNKIQSFSISNNHSICLQIKLVYVFFIVITLCLCEKIKKMLKRRLFFHILRSMKRHRHRQTCILNRLSLWQKSM